MYFLVWDGEGRAPAPAETRCVEVRTVRARERICSLSMAGSEDRSQVLMLAWCQVLLFLRHFTNPSHFFGVESHVTEYHLEFVVPSS